MNVYAILTVGALCATVPSAQDKKAAPAVGGHAQDPAKAPAKEEKIVLDNTRWYVDVTPDAASEKAGEKAFSDVFVFDKDMVTLTACLQYGFAPSKYHLTPNGGRAELKTEQTSPKAGRTAWQGQIAGDAITGELTLTKPDGKVANFTFRGKQSTPLEGTTWTVTIEPPADDEDAKAHEAKLTFEKGKLVIADVAGKTTTPAVYTLTKSSDGWQLSCRDRGAALVVHANIKGTTIKGTTEKTAAGGDEAVECAFTGRRTADAATAPAVPIKQ